MPKRSHENDTEYLRRKLRKIEKKLAKCEGREKCDQNISRRNSGESNNISPLGLRESELQLEGENRYDFLESYTVDDVQPGPSTSAVIPAVTDAPQTEIAAETEPVLDSPATPQLDEDILNLLGETPSKDKKYGPDIRNELAVRWEHIATSGLSKELKKEIFDNHPIPKNCTKMDAPILNPEIKAALSDWLIKKDKALENKQKQLATCITCISEALNRLFTEELKDPAVIKLLIEAGRLICDAQYGESMTRRGFICSSIKKDIKDQLFNTEIDCFLFGEKLADTLRTVKAISKSGAEIKMNSHKEQTRKSSSVQKQRPTSAQALNRRPPLPPARQAGAARRYDASQATMPRPRQPQQQRQPPRSQRQPPARR